MINLQFLIVCLIVAEFIDWVFQWSWEANNKSKWTKDDNKINSAFALVFHSFVYASLSTLITLLILGVSSQWPVIFLMLFISHIIIDNRVTVNYIMRFKGIPKNMIGNPALGFLQLGIDQVLHKVVILVIAIIVA